MTKTRIAILGGGPAALAVAYELSATEALRDRFQIDLYQIGWRLGGKCASSRNRSLRGRNEEHGLHILGGFYHNVFSQLRPLYAEWADVSPKTAIRFEDAFKGHDTFTLMQKDADRWRAVSVELQTNSRVPGVAPELITPMAMFGRMVEAIGVAIGHMAEGKPAGMWLRPVRGWTPEPEAPHLARIAARGKALSKDLAKSAHFGHQPGLISRLVDHFTHAQEEVGRIDLGQRPEDPDGIAAIELFLAIARGFAADRLDVRGFDSINHEDANTWLKRHGASDRAVACPLLSAGYHYSFAFVNGECSRANIAAGVGIRGLLRMVFGYHQSVFMHMLGGMGEILVTPYYEVLKARGVQFHFFHRVEALIPGDDGRLAEIKVRVQAEPKAGSAAYDPLFDHAPDDGGRVRRCWPEAPLYDQLKHADAVQKAGDLEKWIDSAGFGVETTLKADQDFDLCIAGMSIGTLRETATALGEADPAWKTMLDSAGVTPTIAAQIWRQESIEHLGGVQEDGLMTGCQGPLDTWGNMSFLLDLEKPDETGTRPGSLSYFCGPITRGEGPERKTRAESETSNWLATVAPRIFPGLADSGGGYDATGELERYVRINDDPIDLYACSPAGSIERRLRPDDSGFANLKLVGDWTRNNFDCGSVETAVLSAKICARSISGHQGFIYGESDFA